jgi:hypothetical protein
MGLDPSRTAFLSDLMASFATNTAYTAAQGTDTDMVIESNPVHGTWGAGFGRVEYSAALKAVEEDRTVYFWEQLKDRSVAEEQALPGKKGSGTKAESAVGPGSASWEWGYGTQLAHVEEVAHRHGFTVRVVLARTSATW